MASDLIFPADTRNDGFAIDSMARRNGTPETIVRELLQNSLDAAREAGKATRDNPARVTFTITECSWDEVPGQQAYRTAFEKAVEYRQAHGNELPQAEIRVIERISAALQQLTVRLLFCRDNGIGIDDMERILNESNSSKPRKGGGSIGVGHLTAYAGSDTRYILYAGCSETKGDIAGGHAILAAHIGGGKRISANGYYVRESADLFSIHGRYQADMPLLLQREIDLLEDTGTVVCITGFNGFHDDDPVNEIARVTATYFLAAILSDEMVVDIENRLSGEHMRVDRETLRDILRREEMELRTRTGWLAGNRAMRAFETLWSGQALRFGSDVEVYYRPLEAIRTRSQVNVFRGGMWVALNPTRPPGLSLQNLSHLRTFDCVVLLHPNEDESSLYGLARAAEGTDHIEFDQYGAMTQEQRSQMQEHFAIIATKLSEVIGNRAEERSYSPEGFATVPSLGSQPQRVLPRVRHRNQGTRTATTRKSNGEDDLDHDGTNRRNRRRRGSSPTPGKRVWVRSTTNIGSDPSTLIVAWQPHEEEDSRNLSVRVLIPSGSDETCERITEPRWLQLASIEASGITTRVGSDPYELPLPKQSGVIRIHLAEPLDNIAGVELDVVRRRPMGVRTDAENRTDAANVNGRTD